MSWSIALIGKPKNVANALEEHSTKMEGQSKLEYDAALAHMVALVKENFGADPIVEIAASGHGYTANGEQHQRQLVVNIKRIYVTLV